MTPLDWVHLTTDIPESGRRFERIATETERAGVVKDLDIAGCPRLVVSYHIRALSGGRYRVEGHIGAEVVQSCVVTLEPVAQTIGEAFDVTFDPRDAEERTVSSEREILSEPDVEPLADGRLEVGRVAYELLAAALDPYPRKPGAELEEVAAQAPAAGQDAGTSAQNPFAVLAKLKDKL